MSKGKLKLEIGFGGGVLRRDGTWCRGNIVRGRDGANG